MAAVPEPPSAEARNVEPGRRAHAPSTATGVFEFARSSGPRSDRLAELIRAEDVIDLDVLASTLAMRSPPERGATVWRGIRATPRNAAESKPCLPRTPAPTDGARAARALRVELEAATARSLEGARRVAVMTGGGVDSSALLGLAVEWARGGAGRSAFAVALDFEGDGDDRPHLAALEAHLGCEVIRVRPEAAAANFAITRAGIDAMPVTWPGAQTIFETLHVAKRAGAERMLVGTGGDFLFDGSPFALARLVRRGRIVEALRSARAMKGFSFTPRSPAFSFVVRPLLARLVPLAMRRARFRKKVSVPQWAGPRLRRFLVEDHHRYVDWSYLPRDTAEQRVAAAAEDLEIESALWDRHQQEVVSGLGRVDPYMDPALVGFMASLPPESLIHGAMRRGLFREAIRGLVPESLRMRTSKAGFEHCFVRAMNAAGGFHSLRHLASATALADAGLVEPRGFRRAFDELASKPIDSWGWGDVWPALMVESFLREHPSRTA